MIQQAACKWTARQQLLADIAAGQGLELRTIDWARGSSCNYLCPTGEARGEEEVLVHISSMNVANDRRYTYILTSEAFGLYPLATLVS